MPTPATKRVPEGTHTVTPHLVVAGAAEAIEFYKKAFGARELMRLPGPTGKLMHACIQIGDSKVFLVDENADWGCKRSAAVRRHPGHDSSFRRRC